MKDKITMRKKGIICTIFIFLMTFYVSAQNIVKEEKTKDKGKAIITIFSNLHSGFGSANNDRGFDLSRAYLGYQYNLSPNLQIKAIADFGKSNQINDHQRIGYLKNALISWKHNSWIINAGLISTTQFKLQEDFWEKRYIMKSFQDEYKFGSSADLGINVAYQFNKYISTDAIIVNGEGYKKIQVKDGLQYGGGFTISPIKELVIRAYASYNEATAKGDKGITNIATFAGYKNNAFSLAVEYNYQTNTDFVEKQNQSGVSVYTQTRIGKSVGVFGRWDYLTSKDKWNETDDGMQGIAGVEFKLGKNIKIAPNFRIWSPKQSEMNNQYYVYLNASFVL